MEFETVNESLLKYYPDAPQSSIFSILWGLREGMVVRVAQTGNVPRIAILRQQLEHGVYLADIQREEDDYPLGVAKVAASNVIEVLANRILERDDYGGDDPTYVVVQWRDSIFIAREEESGKTCNYGVVLYYEGKELVTVSGKTMWLKDNELLRTRDITKALTALQNFTTEEDE